MHANILILSEVVACRQINPKIDDIEHFKLIQTAILCLLNQRLRLYHVGSCYLSGRTEYLLYLKEQRAAIFMRYIIYYLSAISDRFCSPIII